MRGAEMMGNDRLLETLGYDKSPNFLRDDRLESVPGYSHIFRRAIERCSLSGVYVLSASGGGSSPIVPAVYVCDAESFERADIIHKNVWNQNVVPFLMISTPQAVRLYSGFRYADSQTTSDADPKNGGILETAIKWNQVEERLSHFQASAIDDGNLWRKMGSKITPETRLDRRLLNNLKTLDTKLQEKGASKIKAHSLIGKYVYMRYLHDRDILSDWRLQQWSIEREDVFGREAQIESMNELSARLETWLNGSIFPLTLDPLSEKDAQYLRMVAGAFKGDDPTGQMHLNFNAYDFSYIPIETLSVIYEQFLHSTGAGKEVGAYYTPLPIVNFMLEELDDRKPLKAGMKVFDPACGSGAFLVQCYRKLIEREIGDRGSIPQPERLSELLTANIYGIDQDEDACAVAELSLVLTLLDYVDPPDLQHKDHFKLPCLRNRNVFNTNFFDETAHWEKDSEPIQFQWVVGNPPWNEVDRKKKKPHEIPAVEWMETHAKEFPIGRFQLAEAFAWKCTRHVDPDGLIALLLPASTLFKADAHRFRRAFFGGLNVWCAVNFSNLRHILFRGADQPAAAFFYSRCSDVKRQCVSAQTIVTYSPMLANQEAGMYSKTGVAKEMWSIVVNHGEIQHVPVSEAISGAGLTWKLAMWGTARDRRLIGMLSKNFPSLDDVIKEKRLYRSQGVQIRHESSKEPVEFIEEFVGKKMLDVKKIKGYRQIFRFPHESLDLIDRAGAYLRMGHKYPVPACRPPHLIVSAAGSFAVYSDDFIVHPHPHIAISGKPDQSSILKAASLFLSSNFAKYYMFFSTPLIGVERDRIELKPLLRIPIPLGNLSHSELSDWVDLHDSLAVLPPVLPKKVTQPAQKEKEARLFPDDVQDNADPRREILLERLNTLVYESLNISLSERSIVEDFVQSKIKLNDGRLGDEAIRMPDRDDLTAYCDTLRSELNAFVGADPNRGRRIVVVFDDISAMIRISSSDRAKDTPLCRILRAGEAESQEFNKIRSKLLVKRGQWLYFNRSLRIYQGSTVYLFKPMRRMHWLRSQALADASLIVAETINSLGR